MSVETMCRALVALESSTGHWLCAPPEWAAHVGRRWRPFDEEPWNLLNVWWCVGQWVVLRGDQVL